MNTIQAPAAPVEIEEEAEGAAGLASGKESVGALARRVAHDFNNLLTTILGYSELLAARFPDGPEAEYVGYIRGSAERGAALTQELLSAGRQSE